jgi:hypothetical protein
VAEDFLNRYRQLLDGMKLGRDKGRDKEARRERRQERRQERRERERETARQNEYVASIPQEYLDKYGSQAGSMYTRDKISNQHYLNSLSKQGITPQEAEKYGSDVLDITRANRLNQNAIASAQERLTAGSPNQRQQALQESFRLAQSAGIPTARGSEQATRDFYTKEFAKYGDNPNVFGMKDLIEMRNRGESEGDIRRIALTIGKVGPQAQKELGLGYLGTNF